MIPGVGLFYSGLLRRKNALSMIFLGIAGVGVGSFQWFFWGYSLAFSDTGSKPELTPRPDSSATSTTSA
jgi:Amt family ammonium transporter